METSNSPFYMQFSLRLISLIIILVLMYLGASILKPLAFAGIFTLGLIGPSSWLERHHFNRSWAAAVCVLTSLIIIGGIVSFLSSQIAGFKDDVPHLVQQLKTAIAHLEHFLQTKYNLGKNQMGDYLNQGQEALVSHSTSLLGSTVATFTTMVLYLVLIPIYTFLMLIYRSQVSMFLNKLFHVKFQSNIVVIITNTKNVIRSYVGGLVIEMAIVAAINCIGMLILGVKYAILLGILAAIMNVIPYIGIFTAMAISGLVTLSTNNPSTALFTVLLLIGVHLLDSNILLPKIVGSKVKLNALVTIVIVIVGEAIWGIPGMFLSVPYIAILKVIFDDTVSMQHWGILLGEESEHKPSLSKLPSMKKTIAKK